MEEERKIPIPLIGTGLARVIDHERSCVYAAKAIEAEALPDEDLEELCMFGRTGRCLLADKAIEQSLVVSLPPPPIKIPDLKGRTE